MDDVILAECSDEEEFARSGISHGSIWSPRLDELEVLFQKIKNEKVLEFQWKCPGRRNPHEEQKTTEESEKPATESIASGAYDFDFDDDAGPVVPQKLTPKTNTPKSTTKKRTTTLAGIVANMEKHKLMDKLGTEGSPSKSSNN